MAGARRRTNGILATLFPEKRLFIHSAGSTRYIRLTPASQLLTATATLLAVGWTIVASLTVAVDLVSPESRGDGAGTIREAYEDRLEVLAQERDQRAAEARSAQERFGVAMGKISDQQTAILQSVEEQRELAGALELMRDRLHDTAGQRDAALAANDRLVASIDAVGKSLAGGHDATDLDETLTTVSGALAEAAAARDDAAAERSALEQQLADLELRVRVNTRRQDEMVDQLEQAVAMSFGQLDSLFERTDLDVDGLIAKVRSAYSGVGGPLLPAAVSTRSFDDAALNTRFDRLMLDLDRMNLMRIAASKIPYALPVQSDFRFTSGFGRRWGRMHAGVDFAAPRGTPILATAEGVVVDAGRESGYGNVVRIRHEFGFETVYAHQSRIRVRVGQQVSRGVQIGDMGSTGRSTGSHLHYEVRVNGQPVNPMTYLEAAKDVF